MRVFFSAGEASGDAYAGEILSRIKRLAPQTSGEGVGGPRLRAAGATIIADSSSWGAIGAAQVARVYFKALRGLNAAKAALKGGEPGLFVPIDYGYMNLKLARFARQHGWKTLYFSPPGAWRRDRQGADLPAVSDAIVTPFSWSADRLNAMGAKAHWFGHPIKQMIAESSVGKEAEARETIAALPGSRRAELEQLLPIIADALRDRSEIVEFAIAPNLSLEEVQARWRALCPRRDQDRFLHNATYAILRRARAGVICSGTATLEAALCGCPHVVAYRVNWLTVLEARLIGFKPTFISQPNLILQRMAVPELLQDAVTAENLQKAFAPLMLDSGERQAQLKAFRELDEALGPADALDRTAQLCVEMLAQNDAPV